MLPYQDDGKRLEKLLENIFDDTIDDVGILKWPGRPKPRGGSCCTYSYGMYGT
jgi:hypothetical protein